MRIYFWLLVISAFGLAGVGLASQHDDIWLKIARAYFAQQCEVNDWEVQDSGQTAYYFTCLI